MQYELASRKRSTQKQTEKNSPHVVFANANNDEKLIAFVRTFGPVAAKSVRSSDYKDGKGILLTAKQNLAELRRERLIYHSAFSLVAELSRSSSTPKDTYDDELGKRLIANIAGNIRHWPDQWQRERAEHKFEPQWRPSEPSLKRIEQLASSQEELPLPLPLRELIRVPLSQNIDARIVICELVNVFPSFAFPNPLEMNSSIRYGIRPLLYAILRREFMNHRATAICANNQCRDFFEIEREGQQFCDPICSRQQRQREYWNKRGKKLRAKRPKRRR